MLAAFGSLRRGEICALRTEDFNREQLTVRINKDEGIFIGSNKKIILSSTNAIKDNNNNYIGDPNIANSGANVELSP